MDNSLRIGRPFTSIMTTPSDVIVRLTHAEQAGCTRRSCLIAYPLSACEEVAHNLQTQEDEILAQGKATFLANRLTQVCGRGHTPRGYLYDVE